MVVEDIIIDLTLEVGIEIISCYASCESWILMIKNRNIKLGIYTFQPPTLIASTNLGSLGVTSEART
jgi:hypothetical protein